jgi:hypothetical protein
MSRNLLNLLPRERTNALRREYFVRLATVALLLLTFLVAAHGVFLIPSYLAASSEERVIRAQLTADAGQGGGGESVASEFAALGANAAYLARFNSAPSSAAALRAVLSVPRAGVSITSLTLTPSVGGAPAKMIIAGTADTRENLRAYDLALTNAPGVSRVDLPVSDYAQATDITFSMTVTGTLSP